MKTKTPEAAIAKIVVSWLEARGLDVYQEVELWPGGPRADIVAKHGPEITIVETKSAPSMALLGQLLERRAHAHRIYAATPPCGRGPFIDLARICGFGVLDVHGADGQDYEAIRERVESARFLRTRSPIAARLRPEHKTAAPAGSQTGGHWTAFRDTCTHVAAKVAAQPGITIKEALEQKGWRHHYTSDSIARRTLLGHIQAGVVSGVRLEAGLLYPTEAT